MPHQITDGPAEGALAVTPDEFERIRAALDDSVGTPLAEDWGAFWADADRPPAASVVIAGRLITLPPRMNLRIERLFIEAKGQPATMESMRPLMTAVLGSDLLDWLIDEAGVDDEQLQVLMMWAMGNLSGKRTTLQQALQAKIAAEGAQAEAEPESPGKGNRASRRSSGTGRRSSGTSARTGA